jgi:hypothetical protein
MGKRYPKTPKRPFPKDAHGACFVGELLKPLLGPERVYRIARYGGLIPYLRWRIALRRLMTR